jgi:hypothetical protein
MPFGLLSTITRWPALSTIDARSGEFVGITTSETAQKINRYKSTCAEAHICHTEQNEHTQLTLKNICRIRDGNEVNSWDNLRTFYKRKQRISASLSSIKLFNINKHQIHQIQNVNFIAIHIQASPTCWLGQKQIDTCYTSFLCATLFLLNNDSPHLTWIKPLSFLSC